MSLMTLDFFPQINLWKVELCTFQAHIIIYFNFRRLCTARFILFIFLRESANPSTLARISFCSRYTALSGAEDFAKSTRCVAKFIQFVLLITSHKAQRMLLLDRVLIIVESRNFATSITNKN